MEKHQKTFEHTLLDLFKGSGQADRDYRDSPQKELYARLRDLVEKYLLKGKDNG